jgi:uncharacterized membrane protein YeaQ/YmgE (transglycosylase-associated protein family)
MLLLFMVVWGLVAGWIAHLILRGTARPDWTVVFIAGLGGSLIGGTVAGLLAGDGFALRLSGIVGSVLGALLILGILYGRQAARAQPGKGQGKGKQQPAKSGKSGRHR